eukprot:421456_1
MLIHSLLNYYKSFFNIFWENKSPENKIELFHWSAYQFFKLWHKSVSSDNSTGKDIFITHLSININVECKYVFFTRWILIMIILWLPVIFLLLGIFQNDIFFALIENPDYFGSGLNPKVINNCAKYKILTSWPISEAYYFYIHHISQYRDISVHSKYLFYKWCKKYSIPTIKCIETLQEINEIQKQCKEQEFIIKYNESSRGYGMFKTRYPQKYLSQIPNIVIQKRLRNHKSIITITKNLHTLNTFRICTYSKEINLPTETYLKVQLNEDSLVDSAKEHALFYDKDSNTFSKMLTDKFPMIIPSKHSWDIFVYKLDGLNEFIKYLTDIHHQYLNDIIGIGWDATKIENGRWIIVECNPFVGYYYSHSKYSKAICDAYIHNIRELSGKSE